MYQIEVTSEIRVCKATNVYLNHMSTVREQTFVTSVVTSGNYNIFVRALAMYNILQQTNRDYFRS